MSKGNKIIIGIAVVVVCFIIADYFGFIGYVHKDGLKPLPFNFKVCDDQCDELLTDINIEQIFDSGYCHDLRFISDGNNIFTGYVHVGWGGTQTLFFNKCKTVPLAGKEFCFRFSSPGYKSIIKNIVYEQLNKGNIIYLSRLDETQPVALTDIDVPVDSPKIVPDEAYYDIDFSGSGYIIGQPVPNDRFSTSICFENWGPVLVWQKFGPMTDKPIVLNSCRTGTPQSVSVSADL